MYVFPDTGSGGALQPNLASIVGAIPAGYNMLAVPGATQNFQTDWSDFTNTRNWAFGSISGGSQTQITLVTGLSSPDSSSHATKLAETAQTSQHGIYYQYGLQINMLDVPVTFRLAAICRAVERTRVVLDMPLPFGTGGGGGTQAKYQVSVGYDLAGGNTGYDNVVGTNLTLVGTHMTSLTDGWWLCYFDFFVSSGALTPLTTTNNQYYPDLLIDNGSGTAARSISYAGTTGSGIEVLWFNLLPKHAWDFTQLAFSDDFTSLSTIDLTNSKAPGFNWYINNTFANSGPGTQLPAPAGTGDWGSFWAPNIGQFGPSTAGNFSIVSPSVLQIYGPTLSAHPGYLSQLMSVVSTSNTPGTVPGYIGSAFYGPMFVEMSAVFDTTFADFNPFWQGDGVIIWGSSTATLTQVGFAADGSASFREWDMSGGGNRVRTAAVGAEIHDWLNPQSPIFVQNAQDSPTSGQSIFDGSFTASAIDNPEMNFRNGFRKMSGLWVTAAYNNYTWGYLMGFGDGQWVGSTFPYSPAGVFNNAYAVGIHALADGHLFPIFISIAESNGASAPASMKAQIDWVRVWQPPTIPTVYAFWNPLDMGTAGTAGLAPTLSQNGYQVTKTGSDASWQSARAHKYVGFNNIGGPVVGAVGVGKWYWEHTLTGNSVGNTSDFILGFGNSAATVVGSYPGSSAKGAGLQYNTAANTNVNGVTGLTASSITWAANDVIGFAFDADAGHVYVHKNGTYINGNPGSGNGVWTVTGDAWWPMVAMKTAGSTNAVSSNFGQKAFAFSVPSGYNAGVF